MRGLSPANRGAFVEPWSAEEGEGGLQEEDVSGTDSSFRFEDFQGDLLPPFLFSRVIRLLQSNLGFGPCTLVWVRFLVLSWS